ncbi:Rieske 2Fe-2S domain-containing protein [Pirellulales bacterium]|jgi:nitrite reductase/ring-hydroxylating ferredoxin subunit|nr:Rieske 2Fe-2S domain-containing protein [Pirellulales bacterium]MDC0373330.1 Rieske 2Fe-2S domain-containing protein [bacterium]
MADWIDIAATTECPPGKSIERVAANAMVALANVDGHFYAIDGLCPHQGGPLGTGDLCGIVLTCPWHGWQFDVTTGQHRYAANVRQQTYEVKVESGRVFVRKVNSDAATQGGPSA